MKKIISSFFILLSLLYFTNCTVSAAESKTIDVELPKDYISATFNMDFERSTDGLDVIVINPDGVEYKAEVVNKNSMKCVVNSVKKGRWKIYITSYNDNAIGIVDVKVEGSQTQMITDNKDIKVAADITGLTIYMRDDTLVVEWSDNSCGAVDIKVSDAVTLQVLEEHTVKKKEPCIFEFKIGEEERDLLVTVVPSTSSNISGAAKSFSIDTTNNPSAIIEFENVNETNKNSFQVDVLIEEKYNILCYANNDLVEESGFINPGNYTFNLPVAAGSNNYKVYIEDDKGYLKSFSASCFGDFIAPQLKLTNLNKDIIISQEKFRIEGIIEDFTSLTVNGKTVANIYDDDTFWYEYNLHEGQNNIEIIATDSAGNKTIVNRIITYTIKDYTLLYIGIGVCSLGIIIGICVWKFKSMRPVVKDNDKKKREQTIKKDKKVEQKKVTNKKTNGNHLYMKYQWGLNFVCVIIPVFIFLKFMVLVVVISSNSMEPCMKKGDIAIFNRLAFVLDEVQRGDIICFYSEDENKYLGKRVIGLPGDKIEFIDGYVVINGEFMDESMYIDENVESNCNKEFTVPEEHYFVMGDNREVSYDSRMFPEPYISHKDIKGKYIGFSGINIE